MSELESVPVAEFKRDFHRFAAEVERGSRILVTRHGRPIGEFVPASAAGRTGVLPTARRPGGLMAVLGMFDDWESMEADMAAVVASRRRSRDRPPADLG